ncbi:hypothetical protein PYW07_002535 [Mythimna separata]|uniref:Peptidase C1A papain C-terminal domain-containing protein n=1 Tax=Mythimna separata TaxID=271217 RepID=A0AAD8DQI5_MYTSE|nr:hypothetical protein PYW07_002535 [Mythimna separata]
MRACTLTLFCALGAALAAVAPPHSPRPARALTDTGERWRNLIAEYSRAAGGAGGAWASGGWFPPVVPIQVPLQGDGSGRASVSVLVVPVPVPVPAPRADPAQCAVPAPPDNTTPRALAPTYSEPAGAVYHPGNNVPPYIPPPINNQPPPYNQVPVFNQRPTSDSLYNPLPWPQPSAFPSPPAGVPASDPAPRPPPDVQYESPPAPAPPRPPPRHPDADDRLARNAPNFPPVENSQLLVEQFLAQVPEDPSLPPIVIDPVGVVSTDDYTAEELQEAGSSVAQAPAEAQTAAPEMRRLKCKRRRVEGGGGGSDEEREAREPPPPPPRFERSLFLRARLTLPRAGFTETYSVWWDAASGASRVDFHGGATSTYRMMKRDGRVQSVQIRVDRTAESDVRRCVVSAPRRLTLAERALPALPDLQAFSFAGYVVRGTDRAERWRHTLSGHSGELGGARGEALTFRHELLVTRSADNYTTTPHWYSVRVDSSVLGTDCDGYVHQFDEVQARHHDASMFQLNIADACEQVEITNRMESVEPLREFTMLRRDPRHDREIEQYKRKFGRVYADDVEEAVRKNILMQSSRHVAAGNRQGASMELATNFLSDRLQAEQRVMLGVQEAPEQDPGAPFPHARAELDALRGRLPRRFDWRERGAVTPVRNQWLCSSCWAFATVGAVEGALFVESGRLVPLSEQALVDCAQPYGGHGCKGTWPSSAYNYIQDQGLPALDEYTPYKAKEQQCRADSVPAVTRISGHLNVTKDNILALKVAIKKYGPTVVLIDGQATSLVNHKKGYYHDGRCKRNSHNHAVLAVGWQVHRGETYFILKNSWSTAWGEEGYVRMRASTNTCGVLRRPSVPRLRAADVLRVPAGARAAAAPNDT